MFRQPVLGLPLVVPLVVVGIVHMLASKIAGTDALSGLAMHLFVASIVVLVTGFLLMRVGGFDLKQAVVRRSRTGCTSWCRLLLRGCTGCIG